MLIHLGWWLDEFVLLCLVFDLLLNGLLLVVKVQCSHARGQDVNMQLKVRREPYHD